MITGFNTNVRYRGRMFHIQTEDSGRDRPHIISHLYCGGTILASEKSDYSEHLDTEDLESQVRLLMEAQHKSMLSRLKAAEYDQVISERLASESGSTTSPSLADAEPPPRPAPAAPRPAPAAAAAAAGPREFGDGVVSQKPLDEVILEYLVEKARARGPARAPRPPRRTEAKG